MVQHFDEAVIRKYVDMGFERDLVIMALTQTEGNEEAALNYMIESRTTVEADPELERVCNLEVVKESMETANETEQGFVSEEDEQMSKAIEMSMEETHGVDFSSFEPLNPEQRQRQEGVPVGIKNVGNTCYFNSLLQTYFMIPKFVQEVLTFTPHPHHLQEENKEAEGKRKKASIHLIEQLQRLFAYMISSHRKYIDPSSVLNALVDDFGNQIHIGDQKDVGEFNMILLARIEEGLKTKNFTEDSPHGETDLRRTESILTANELTEEGIVSSLFYGKQNEHLLAREADGNIVELDREEIFGEIMIDIDDSDLYSAWDSAYHSSIEGYITSSGHVTNAEQDIWIKKLPDMLLFQIQRVKYDLEFASSVKSHKPFNFPEVIFPDRFMEENKELSISLREKMLILKRRAKLLQEKIEKFQKFEGMEISLFSLLKAVAGFLGSQGNDDSMELIEEQLDLYSTEQIETDPEKLPQLAVAQDLILKYAEDIQNKVEHMKQQLQEHNDEIEAIFNLEALKKTPYHLHSILIHEGLAGSGHYYAYIFDPSHQVWRKYNDIHVSVVEKEQVLKDALGGNGLASAYCLVYIHENLLNAPADLVLRSYSIFSHEEAPDEYSSYIPNQLNKEVSEDNQKLIEELIDYKIGSIMRNVQEIYMKRYMLVSTQINSKKENEIETIKHELINLAVFIKLKGYDNLFKWYLLDMILKETEERGLDELDPEEPLYEKLSNEFKVVCKEAPESLTLTEYQREQLADYKASFYSNYIDASVDIYILDNLIKNRYLDAFYGIFYQLSANKPENEYLAVTRDANKILILRLTSEIMSFIYKKELMEAIKYAWYVILMTTFYIDDSDTHFEIIKYRLGQMKEVISHHASEKLNEDIDKEIDDINMALETGNFNPCLDFEQLPESLEKLKKEHEAFDPYEWVEGWKKESVASKFVELSNEIGQSGIQFWVQIHEKIAKNKQVVAYDFHEAESKIGIIPKETH